jgi:hypothetical protein
MDIPGLWNLPSIEEQELSGILNINQTNEVIYLTIQSSISLGLYNEFDTITGTTSYGTDVTLYKCHVARETIHVGAKKQYETQIIVEYVFYGIAFKSRDKILFHEVKFRFSNLDEWAFLKGFDLSRIENCDFALRYKTPKEIEYKLNDVTSMVIWCSLHSPLALVIDKDVKVTQKVYVSVKHKNPQTFEHSLSIIKTLMSFVSLSIGKPVKLIEVSGFNSEHFQIYNDEGDKIYHEISIYTPGMSDEKYEAIDPRLALLNLRDIKNDFELYIGKWFEKKE